MGEIITRKGLMKLVDKKLTGEELPKNWKMDVDKYVERKIRALSMKKETYLNCKNELEEAQDARRFLHGRKKDD